MIAEIWNVGALDWEQILPFLNPVTLLNLQFISFWLTLLMKATSTWSTPRRVNSPPNLHYKLFARIGLHQELTVEEI